MCIGVGMLIVRLAEKIPRKKIAQICMIAAISGVGIFGLVNLVQVVTTDMTSAQYAAVSFVLNDTKDTKDNASIFTGPTNSWVLDDIFHKKIRVDSLLFAFMAHLYKKSCTCCNILISFLTLT